MPNRTKPARPPVAIEIASDRVVAARAANDGGVVEAYAARPLPAGVVTPNLQAANVAEGNALAQAIGSVLESVGPRTRDVTVILPDACARVMLMDFDTLPERESEALPLVRFRLKKLLPFDADRASISYQAFRNGGIRVAAAVAATAVVEEYEAACHAAGYNPGVILPSMVAALGLVDGSQATLVIKCDLGTTSVAIVDRNELRLVRTLEGEGAPSPEQLADEVYPLLVFFQDTFGSRIDRILVGGNVRVDAVRAALESQTGARVQELVSTAVLSPGGSAQVPTGALAGVAGAVLNL